MTVNPGGMTARKRRHIEVCLTDAVGYHGVTTGLLLGNIGLSQWSKPAAPDIAKALGRVGADDLAVHTNPLQEADQHNGDTDFSGPLVRLRDVAGKLRYPTLFEGGRPRHRRPRQPGRFRWQSAPAWMRRRRSHLRERGGSRPATARGAMESAAGAPDWLHCFIEELRSCLLGCDAPKLPAVRRIGVTSIP